jgi:hypothetical protein
MKDQKPIAGLATFADELAYVWAIGIYLGQSPLRLSPATHVQNPVLTYRDVSDAPAAFVADPFMLRAGGTWHMFFEVFNRASNKGEIALATSPDGFAWEYRRRVLAEPFHLSYPYVFDWQGKFYMIPETLFPKSIQLYEALSFPDEWVAVGALIEGEFADPSVVYFERRWWLFACPDPLRNNILRLFFADDLSGPWTEHPRSPIIQDNEHLARPAGRVLVLGHRLIRYTQDCSPMYGTQVRACEIIELTTTAYREAESAESPVIMAQGSGWNEVGMHHLDAHQMSNGSWIACVDGMRPGRARVQPADIARL